MCVKQKVRRSVSGTGILQTNLMKLNQLQAEIVIIDPKPYQSTHFSIYRSEFTDGFVQGKPNIDEYL